VLRGREAHAAGRQGIAKFQQTADLVERHVQRAAPADETQALGVLVVVDAVVAVGARGLGQELLALVVPDGFDRRVRDLGQFSDFHDAANQRVEKSV
jgi:hypothetical protein